MKNPCKPDCERRNIYCHSYCKDYLEWKKHYKTRDAEEQEYLEYVSGAIERMKGCARWG